MAWQLGYHTVAAENVLEKSGNAGTAPPVILLTQALMISIHFGLQLFSGCVCLAPITSLTFTTVISIFHTKCCMHLPVIVRSNAQAQMPTPYGDDGIRRWVESSSTVRQVQQWANELFVEDWLFTLDNHNHCSLKNTFRNFKSTGALSRRIKTSLGTLAICVVEPFQTQSLAKITPSYTTAANEWDPGMLHITKVRRL